VLTLGDTTTVGKAGQSCAEPAAATGSLFSPALARPAHTFRRLLAELPGM
jgi:hypothetical protein